MNTTSTLDQPTSTPTTSTPAPAIVTPAPVLGCRMLRLSAPVNVTLSQGGRLLGFDSNGKVIDGIGLGTVELTVAFPPDYSAIGVHIDENTHIPQRLKDEGDEATGSIFRRKCQIFKTDGPNVKFFPDKTANNIRWVEISQKITANAGQPNEERGVFVELFVVSLVSQRGNFYLTFQSMVSAEAFNHNDGVRIPEMRRSDTWRDLGKMLEGQLTDLVGSLPFRQREEIIAPKRNDYDHSVDAEITGNVGVVLNYSLRRQYGAVRVMHPETRQLVTARVYFGSVCTERPDGLLYLLSGEKIRWARIEKPAQPGRKDREAKAKSFASVTASDVLNPQAPPRKRTEYEWELKGVKVIA